MSAVSVRGESRSRCSCLNSPFRTRDPFLLIKESIIQESEIMYSPSLFSLKVSPLFFNHEVRNCNHMYFLEAG